MALNEAENWGFRANQFLDGYISNDVAIGFTFHDNMVYKEFRPYVGFATLPLLKWSPDGYSFDDDLQEQSRVIILNEKLPF